MILLNTKTICLAVMLVLFLAFQLTVFFYMKNDDDKVVDVMGFDLFGLIISAVAILFV